MIFLERFILRPWRIDDIDSLLKYADNEKIARNMRNIFPHPYTKEKGLAFFERIAKDNPVKILAIEVNGEAIGSVGVFQQDDIYEKNAEIGYWLAEPFWGQGIMTDVVKEMVKYGFNTWPVNRIYAGVFEGNTASEKVLQKAGFTLEARLNKTYYKNSQYFDEIIYAIRRSFD